MKTLLAGLAMLAITGCTVIDTNRIDGVRQLAIWRDAAVNRVPSADPRCKEKYDAARSQVASVIDITWKSNIDNKAAQWWGTVDLSTNAIPTDVSSAVAEFLPCSTEKADEKIVTKGVGVVAATAITTEVITAIDKLVETKRKASADGLKATLVS
ncbi:MAG: hypothetical protein WC701_13250 [Kiritimatiellales bacterium]|jgi:hypothetical protein